MKRYMTVFMTLALLLASTLVFAQTTKSTGNQVQAKERLARLIEAEKRFPYRNPGQSPVVLPSELTCAFGKENISVGQLELLALWGDGHSGDHDNCTQKGLLPISQRLTERFYQWLGAKDEPALKKVLFNLSNGRFVKRVYLPAKDEGGKLVLSKPMPELPEGYRSRGGAITDFPPVPLDFQLHALLVDPVRPSVGTWHDRDIKLAITTSFVKENDETEIPCINFTGEFGFASEREAVTANEPSIVKPELKASTTSTTSRDVHPSWGMNFEVGIAYELCGIRSSYSGAAKPGTGDATQHNRCSALIPTFRIEPRHGNGLFVTGQLSVLDHTGPKYFDDPVQKIRESDSTKDRGYEPVVGYTFELHGVGLSPFVGYSSLCLCEHYTAQGATTDTQRAYKEVIGGAEARFVSSSRLTVRIRGTYGHGHRSQWTQQTYPGVNFPRVDQPNVSASSVGLRPSIEAHAAGPIYANVSYDFRHISSNRTNTFAAAESVNLHTLTIGVSYKFGRS